MNQDNIKSIGDELEMATFTDEFQKAYLNLLFTANYLSTPIHQALKEYELSHYQYNVLRILRGQKGKPISAIDIQNRMIHQSSNVSRILEKLLAKGLVESAACPENRRKNNIVISTKGLDLLKKTDSVPVAVYEKMAASITHQEAQMMNKILDKLRDGAIH